MSELTDYTALITSEHRDKPRFMGTVGALVQPIVDQMNVLQSMPAKFDLDNSVGVQLDDVGLWVGVSRKIRTPLTGIYFSFDIAGLGFDQGTWKGPFDPDTGLTVLDDDTYRLVIRAKIGANHWDGTLASSAAPGHVDDDRDRGQGAIGRIHRAPRGRLHPAEAGGCARRLHDRDDCRRHADVRVRHVWPLRRGLRRRRLGKASLIHPTQSTF